MRTLDGQMEAICVPIRKLCTFAPEEAGGV